MGSALGAALERGGARVVATLDGRSPRTARLAARAGLELLPDLEAVVRDASVLLSVVPPEASEDVARDVLRAAAATGARPLLVELNAISPERARRIAETARAAGVDVVDGSVSGPPPWRAGTTRVYLSGPRASEVAELPFDGVETTLVGADVGAASAVKMSTASVYKGTSALLVHALLAADANGVLEHVLDDLRTAAPDLVANVERRLASAATKSSRYVAEMREIAATQEAAGLTPALFDAMAEIYETLAQRPLASGNPEEIPAELELRDVLDGLS
jgi:3-hydroxyisobutyrate dehydrogenase-like beta-hydroxyacid dehydrogenase